MQTIESNRRWAIEQDDTGLLPARRRSVVFGLAALVFAGFAGAASAETVVEWDFSKGTHGWTGNARVERLTFSSEGLLVRCTGEDPWIEGPAVDLTGSEVTRVRIRMKSSADSGAELFYGRAFQAGRSVRFTVYNDGQWHDYSLAIHERLGPGIRFRLDPCMDKADVKIAFIAVERIEGTIKPALAKPQRPDGAPRRESVRSGPLELEHYGDTWGSFLLKVNGAEMAAGYDSELIGVILEDRAEWLNLKNAKVKFSTLPVSGWFVAEAVIKDGGGAKYELLRRVRSGERAGTIEVELEFKVDKDREVVRLPWLSVFPGLGTFGPKKHQGLFAGLEYLCDEPSSSEADIAAPHHIRRTPDPVKITFPLMAVAYNGNYIGLVWQPSEMLAATFDSPDRIYGSGAQVVELSGPGVGDLRFENAYSAHTPIRLRAGQILRTRILIIGGKGKSIVPAVKHYLGLRPLPQLPRFEGGFDAAVNLLAHGWLDSAANRNWLFRHAVWGESFGPSPAADAAMFMDWLSLNTADSRLRERLQSGRQSALQRLPAGQPFSSGVSHVRPPAPPLVFGRVHEYVRQRRRQALAALRGFAADGTMEYRPRGTDYSRTHFAKHANGLGGRSVADILEAASLCGDKELTEGALELLDKQTALYAETVPRGAQTWEVPLHTPDILACAHMVRAYALGYIISGRSDYLEQARYWAWTGVPFVYLHPPTEGRVGLYSTIAVLGATNWRAPSWFGQPVQWCGLVYGSALHLLSECDPAGPWERIARGITAAGLQMTWPLSDKERQGLLPDYFLFRPQVSDGPAINPGTVQAHLAELYGKGKIYDVKKLGGRAWFAHAPCAITDIREGPDSVSFVTAGRAARPYHVLVSGIEQEPARVLVQKIYNVSENTPASKSWAEEYHPDTRSLVISLTGKAKITVR